jgi:hypothetical protein
LAGELGNRATVLRVSIHTDLGKTLGKRYGFQFTPQYVILDGSGQVKYNDSHLPTKDQVLGK